MSPQSVVLRRGDSGPAVADVCERLLLTGDLPASWADRGVPRETAVFDETVEEAVKSFQQRRGLLVDGVVGRSTYSVLDGARWALGDRVLRYVPDYFLEGDDVVRLQARLLELGFTPGKVDGIHGPATDAALRSFQAAVGLTSDGTLGPETLRAFQALQRSVTGGSANALREREQIRRGGFSLTGRTVVLDPGHGGGDPGAVGHGLVEADLTLDLASRIEGRLTAHGVEVMFTRTGTTAGEEVDRAAFANSLDADLVLSIHTDHSEAAAAHGAATFFYGHGDPGRRTQGAWSTIGEHFAELLLREVVARTGLTDCRSHPRSWPLLRRTRMPAVRLEVGYLSHPSDAATLADPLTRDRIAEAVVVALQRLYLGDADTARTGMLKLADLRRHIESARDGHPEQPQPDQHAPDQPRPGASA